MHWSFEDPTAFEGTDGEELAKFREIRDKIEGRIQAWLEEQGISRKSCDNCHIQMVTTASVNWLFFDIK